MNTKEFSDFLVAEMRNKDWSQADLARAAGLTRAAISNYVSEKVSKPDEFALRHIANALELPPETLFRIAGILPQANKISEATARLNHIFVQLSESDQEDTQAYVEFKLQKYKQELERQRAAKRVKTGPLPGMGG